jgi:hypothetical protein
MFGRRPARPQASKEMRQAKVRRAQQNVKACGFGRAISGRFRKNRE